MATVTWDGSTDTDYGTAANWDTGSVPTSSDDVIIANVSNDCVLDGSRSVKSFVVQAGGDFNGNAETLTVVGENGSGYAVDIDGDIVGTNTMITITTPATTLIDLAATSGNVRDLTINHASCVATMYSDVSLSRNLTITAGQLTTGDGGYGYSNLTVAGKTSVNGGSLTCNSGTISLGASYTADYALEITGGTFVGGSGTHTLGSLYMSNTSAAVCTFTSGVTTISSEVTSANEAIKITGTNAVFNHGSGTVTHTTTANTQYVRTGSTLTLNNFIQNNNSNLQVNPSLTCAGDFTMTAGEFDTSGSNYGLTIAGELTVVGGTLTLNASDVIVRNIYASGGTLSAPSNSSTNGLEVTGKGDSGSGDGYSIRIEGGTFTDNNGTVILSADINTFMRIESSLHNFTIRNDGSSSTRVHEFINPTTIGGNLTLTNGSLQSYNTTWGINVTGDVLITKGQLGRSSATYNSSFGSLTIAADGIYIATSGTTTITDIESGASRSFLNNGTFTHNNGTVLFNGSMDQKMATNATGLFNNITLNKSNNDFVFIDSSTTVEGDLDITMADNTRQCRPSSTSGTITVLGNVIVREGIMLRSANDCSGNMEFGGLILESGGIYGTTSGTTKINGALRNIGGTIN